LTNIKIARVQQLHKGAPLLEILMVQTPDRGPSSWAHPWGGGRGRRHRGREASELRLLRWAALETAANAKAGLPKLAFLSRIRSTRQLRTEGRTRGGDDPGAPGGGKKRTSA
jgi:hypothetical protein